MPGKPDGNGQQQSKTAQRSTALYPPTCIASRCMGCMGWGTPSGGMTPGFAMKTLQVSKEPINEVCEINYDRN